MDFDLPNCDSAPAHHAAYVNRAASDAADNAATAARTAAAATMAAAHDAESEEAAHQAAAANKVAADAAAIAALHVAAADLVATEEAAFCSPPVFAPQAELAPWRLSLAETMKLKRAAVALIAYPVGNAEDKWRENAALFVHHAVCFLQNGMRDRHNGAARVRALVENIRKWMNGEKAGNTAQVNQWSLQSCCYFAAIRSMASGTFLFDVCSINAARELIEQEIANGAPVNRVPGGIGFASILHGVADFHHRLGSLACSLDEAKIEVSAGRVGPQLPMVDSTVVLLDELRKLDSVTVDWILQAVHPRESARVMQSIHDARLELTSPSMGQQDGVAVAAMSALGSVNDQLSATLPSVPGNTREARRRADESGHRSDSDHDVGEVSLSRDGEKSFRHGVRRRRKRVRRRRRRRRDDQALSESVRLELITWSWNLGASLLDIDRQLSLADALKRHAWPHFVAVQEAFFPSDDVAFNRSTPLSCYTLYALASNKRGQGGAPRRGVGVLVHSRVSGNVTPFRLRLNDLEIIAVLIRDTFVLGRKMTCIVCSLYHAHVDGGNRQPRHVACPEVHDFFGEVFHASGLSDAEPNEVLLYIGGDFNVKEADDLGLFARQIQALLNSESALSAKTASFTRVSNLVRGGTLVHTHPDYCLMWSNIPGFSFEITGSFDIQPDGDARHLALCASSSALVPDQIIRESLDDLQYPERVHLTEPMLSKKNWNLIQQDGDMKDEFKRQLSLLLNSDDNVIFSIDVESRVHELLHTPSCAAIDSFAADLTLLIHKASSVAFKLLCEDQSLVSHGTAVEAQRPSGTTAENNIDSRLPSVRRANSSASVNENRRKRRSSCRSKIALPSWWSDALQKLRQKKNKLIAKINSSSSRASRNGGETIRASDSERMQELKMVMKNFRREVHRARSAYQAAHRRLNSLALAARQRLRDSHGNDKDDVLLPLELQLPAGIRTNNPLRSAWALNAALKRAGVSSKVPWQKSMQFFSNRAVAPSGHDEKLQAEYDACGFVPETVHMEDGVADALDGSNNDNGNLDLFQLRKEISVAEIKKAISGHKKATAAGPDGITNEMIALVLDDDVNSHQIAACFQALFQAVCSTGYWPQAWRQGMLVTIPKGSGSSTDPADLRPITLLSCIGKLLEKVLLNRFWAVHEQLASESERDNVLATEQNGFRLGGTGALLNAMLVLDVAALEHRMRKSKSRGLVCVNIDIKKAFDTVPHYGVLRALRSMGCTRSSIRLVASLLANRLVAVRPSTEESEKFGFAKSIPAYRLGRGTPQGGVLSPILFNLYDNSMIRNARKHGDLPLRRVFGTSVPRSLQHIKNFGVTAYADDLFAICKSGDSASKLVSALYQEYKADDINIHVSGKKTQAIRIVGRANGRNKRSTGKKVSIDTGDHGKEPIAIQFVNATELMGVMIRTCQWRQPCEANTSQD